MCGSPLALAPLLLLSVVASGTSAAPAAKKGTFGVRARLLSGWPRTTSAAQSLEWLRDVDAGDASSFLRQLTEAGGSASSEISQVALRMRSNAARTFYEVLVRNDFYSPRIETLRSLERNDRKSHGSACPAGAAWALLWPAGAQAPSAACDAAALQAELTKDGKAHAALPPGLVVSELELVLHQGGGAGVIIVYGALSAEGLESLAPLLRMVLVLRAVMETRSLSWKVVFRHADGPSGPEGLGRDDLTGYGFELAVKSSEYKTHADGGDAESGSDPAQERHLDGPAELDGLLFHTLFERHPKLSNVLWAAKDQMEVERGPDAVLKAWEIKDIGLQATARIKASTTPLLELMRISQNFPAHAVDLSRIPIPETLRDGAAKLQSVLRDNSDAFSLNARMVRPDHADLSLFPMMNSLQPFFIGVERLVRRGISEKLACEILKESHGVQTAERLDWRSQHLPPPTYLVTEDQRASRWGPQLQNLLYAQHGQLAPVRLPLYHVVYIFDPAVFADLRTAKDLLGMMPMPISMHFVMVSGGAGKSALAAWDEQALGERPGWLAGAAAATGGEAKDGVSSIISAAYNSILHGFGNEDLHGLRAANAQKFLDALADVAAKYDDTDGRWPNTQDALKKIRDLWKKSLSSDVKDPQSVWESLIRGASKPGSRGANSTAYAAALGVPVPSMLVNGKLLLKAAYGGQQSIYPTITQEQQNLQRAVHQGELKDSSNLIDFLAEDGMVSAYHEDITPALAQRGGEEGMPGQTSDTAYVHWPEEDFMRVPFLRSLEGSADGKKSELNFFHVIVLPSLSHAYLLHTFASHLLTPDRSSLKGISEAPLPPFASHWTVVVDKGTGASEAMNEFAACVAGTLGFESKGPEAAPSVNRQRLLLLKFLGLALPAAVAAAPDLPAARMQELCELAISKSIDPDHRAEVKAFVAAARKAKLDSNAGIVNAASGGLGETDSKHDAALWVCNGRRVALDEDGQLLSARHVQALELMEGQYDIGSLDNDGDAKKKPVETISDWLGREEVPVKVHGLVAAIRSDALSHGKTEMFTQPAEIFEAAPEAVRLTLPPPRPDAASPIKVYGILDPLSQVAQSASGVLALFGMAFNAEVNLVLSPTLRHSKLPLKRYYREVVRWPTLLADGRAVADLEDGAGLAEGSAEFALATQHALTASMTVLPTWLVTSHEAEHDMDNLRQVDVGDGNLCEVTYLLRELYVEGKAYILGEKGWPIAPAKGLQIDVFNQGEQQGPLGDTIVMGNVGYFQVHSDPGLYEVRLKPGLSSATFEQVNTKPLQVSSYITPPYQMRVKVRPGHSHNDLFDKGANSGGSQGVLSSLMGSLFGGQGSAVEKASSADQKALATAADAGETLPTIHIFSVASGHLYEKLLSIMILSVRNHTKCPLHFWFIDNFLSPKFRAFIPTLAKKYDFNFAFVTYKWPSWLNPQSEKQRLIWAYKILFLDVLFPQDVPKVIFIDADQVVRADVQELWDIDLKGKVYGFVPMGDTNKDTEGFRFWKQGYWSRHLNGKHYHISALFVVDLVEFRRTFTGDELRGIYNQLSRDPNSLANLDQDLPNFAQAQVPIFSLPDNWLWCETWCSQGSKPAAKTIDLCQNPLTKEPKIVMAQRIIHEWQGYHNQVQQGLGEFEAQEQQSAQAVQGKKSGKDEL